MYLDKDAVRTDSNRSAGERKYLGTLASPVAGIDEDGQVTQALHRGNDAQIEGVAGVVGERTHAALAEDYLVVALAHHVFGCHQEFFEGRGHTAFEEHGLPLAASG